MPFFADDGFFMLWFVNDIRKGICCLLCLFILGPVLFIIGISVLLSAPFNDTRNNNLSTMNGDISLWNSQYLPQFKDTKWTVYTPANTLQLTASSPVYTSELPDSAGINSYTPYFFSSTSNNVIPSSYYNESLLYPFTYSAANNEGLVQNFTFNVQLFWSNFTDINSQNGESLPVACSNQGGNWDFGVGACVFYNQLMGLCLKVDNVSGLWIPDTQFGGSGCAYNGDQAVFSAGIYKQQLYNQGNVFNVPLAFPAFTLSVRDVHDPVIQAQELTKGSMDFGLTKAQTAATGLAIMIVGIIFMIPCCLFGALLAFACQRRRR